MKKNFEKSLQKSKMNVSLYHQLIKNRNSTVNGVNQYVKYKQNNRLLSHWSWW